MESMLQCDIQSNSSLKKCLKKMYSSRPSRRSRSNPAAWNSPLPVQVSTSSKLAAVFIREQTGIRPILHQGKRRMRVNAVYNTLHSYIKPKTYILSINCNFHCFLYIINQLHLIIFSFDINRARLMSNEKIKNMFSGKFCCNREKKET